MIYFSLAVVVAVPPTVYVVYNMIYFSLPVVVAVPHAVYVVQHVHHVRTRRPVGLGTP